MVASPIRPIRYAILGPLEIHDGERLVELGSGRQRVLITLLLLRANEPVPSEQIVDRLWGGRAPPTAAKIVQNHVSQVRRLLGAPGGEGGDSPLITRGGGYELRLRHEDLDSNVFERLADEGSRALEEGDAERAAARLGQALAMWRGPPLTDCAYEDFAQAEIARLEERRLFAVEQRAAAELALGRHGDVLAELDALLASHPLRERLCELLMLALYRSGRQADALAAYRRTRGALAELGLDPGPELRRLEVAILQHDEALAGAARPATTPARAPAPADAAPVTILFTDIHESTALQARHGDARAREAIAVAEGLARMQVADHGGRVVKSLGDGLMVAFSSPRAAVWCALRIVDAVREHGRRRPELRVSIRVGVHTGEALEEAGDLHGAAVSAAARICDGAAAGEVLVSDVVRQLCGSMPDAAFEPGGRRALKGLPGRWPLYRAAAAPRAAAAGSDAFVGRRDVRAGLRELMDRVASGHGAIALIGGEPGVGKTRLVEELAAEARQAGWGAFIGHCYETAAEVPYQPWAEVIAAGGRQFTAEEILEVFGEDAPALARMVPELRRMAPAIEPSPELPADQLRRYLFDSVRRFATRRAEKRPILLVFEDLHWADEATLVLLEHAVEWVQDASLLIVGTCRDACLDRPGALGGLVDRLTGRRHARVIRLPRHTVDEVAALLEALGGERPPPAVGAAIHAATDGNAFYVVELFRHLAETGRLLDDHGAFREDLRLDALDVPPNVRLVVARRLERLSEPTRRALALAAVIGRSFSVRLLEQAGELGPDELLDALEEAQAAHLVADDPAAEEPGFRFTHEVIRGTLLSGLTRARRERLHLRVADALEQARDGDADRRVGELAHHLSGAGASADPARTARHLVRAGDRSRLVAAWGNALRHYEATLAILPPERRRERADTLLRIGLTRRSLLRWDEAVAAWDEALGLLEREGDAQAVGAVCWVLCLQLMWGYRFGELADVARRGLAALGDPDSAERARLLGMMGLAEGLAGDGRAASRRLEAARAAAERLADPEVTADVRLTVVVDHYFYMRLADAAQEGRAACERLREVGHLWDLAEVLAWRGVALTFGGCFGEALGVLRELKPLAERVGHWGAMAAAMRCDFAMAAATRPDLAGLERLVESMATLTEDTGIPGQLGYCHTVRGVVASWRGDLGRARAELDAGVRLAGPFWEPAQRGFRLVLLAMEGRRAELDAAFEEVAPLLPRAGEPNLLGAWTLGALAAEAAALAGDAERARALLPLVVGALETGTAMRPVDGRLLTTVAGMAAAAAGLAEEAEAHFERALRQARALPHRLDRAHAEHELARLLLHRGAPDDAERARALLADAAWGFHAIGMQWHEARAARLAARAGGRRSAGHPVAAELR